MGLKYTKINLTSVGAVLLMRPLDNFTYTCCPYSSSLGPGCSRKTQRWWPWQGGRERTPPTPLPSAQGCFLSFLLQLLWKSRINTHFLLLFTVGRREAPRPLATAWLLRAHRHPPQPPTGTPGEDGAQWPRGPHLTNTRHTHSALCRSDTHLH